MQRRRKARRARKFFLWRWASRFAWGTLLAGFLALALTSLLPPPKNSMGWSLSAGFAGIPWSGGTYTASLNLRLGTLRAEYRRDQRPRGVGAFVSMSERGDAPRELRFSWDIERDTKGGLVCAGANAPVPALLLLLLVIAGLLEWKRPRPSGAACQYCGYDRTGTDGRCPECGFLSVRHEFISKMTPH